MAGIMKPLSAIFLVAAVLIAAVSPRSEAAITCGTVVSRLTPCLPYVTGKGPIGKCCDGIKALHESATTTEDRQSVCGCLKSMATAYPGVDYGKAAGLPKECGVDVPYVISPDIDCSKVK
ncbi:non-specific lipid-transfer protein 1-like [Salvia miltiorrhiza]|uniref:non-specific lipid-transfer protein 1-like n=1 Tax=Salvia miltiorrhiza TaxID=226208 RepID=UPI0025ACCFD3|nr:non-specific lipid-transfer protein 1-like [Salvia miltiorrhiza]